jgi:WD40 repeat protein/serine/threonine protein kinase
MSQEHASDSQREQRLDEVATGYLKAVEAGQAPDRQELLARHPDLADELATFFADADRVQRWAGPLRSVAEAGRAAAAAETLVSGTLGDFRILREIGRGGMGIVYEAEQVSLGRRVALKVLPFAGALDPRQLQRFTHEAQAAALLHHTNIVPVHFVGSERGVHFYAMQLIEGQDLARVIAGQKPAPRERQQPEEGTPPLAALSTLPCPHSPEYFRTVSRLGIQAAEALDHAHQRGIVHRDIKPANLLVDAESRLWITDFGLAQIQSDPRLTLTGDLVGTLRYMSPEQALARCGVADHRTDIYSLGATLYELLTLQPAFHGQDRQELLRQIAFEEPRSPRRLNRAVPTELAIIVAKAMEKDPADRYATAQELADDLRRFLDDRPIQARRPTLVKRLAKWGRRHRRLVAASAVVMLLAVLGLTVGIVLIARERDATLERERALRRLLYVQNVQLAHQAWQVGDLARMQDLLERDRTSAGEDLRGFEWHHLWALLQSAPREVARVQDHEGDAHFVTWSPKGETLASGGKDGFVRLWSAPTLQKRAAWRAHEKEVNLVLFSPDGTILATASDDHSIRLWTLPEYTPRDPLTGHGDWVESMAFSPDSKSLAASGRDGVVRLWDVATGQCRQTRDLHAGKIQMLQFSPDGQTLAAATARGGVVLLDVDRLRRRAPVSLAEEVESVTFSPDGRTLAVGRMWNGEISLVEASTHRTLLVLRGHQGTIRVASFAPDGSLLASCGDDGRLLVWELPSGRLRQTINVAHDRVWWASWSPDGKHLATADRSGTVKLYDMSVPPARQTFRFESPTGGVFFRDASRLRALVESSRLWELDVTSQRVKVRTLPARSWFVSGDGSLLGTRWHDCQVEVGDADRERSWQTDCHGLIKALDRSPDGRHLALALLPAPDCHHLAAGDPSQPPVVWLWDLTAGTKKNLGPSVGEHRDVAFSRDGKVLAVADGRRVRIVEVATGKPRQVLEGHSKNVLGFAFSPDGRLLATSSLDRSVRLWVLATGQERSCLFRHQAEVCHLAFSPDGKTLATGDQTGKVVLWHVASGQELLAVDEHRGAITGLAFSPDGKILATSGLSADGKRGEVTLWYGG